MTVNEKKEKKKSVSEWPGKLVLLKTNIFRGFFMTQKLLNACLMKLNPNHIFEFSNIFCSSVSKLSAKDKKNLKTQGDKKRRWKGNKRPCAKK